MWSDSTPRDGHMQSLYVDIKSSRTEVTGMSSYGCWAFAVAGPTACNSLRMICVIRRLALTVSDVCLKLGCFQSTSTYSALEVSQVYALYKFTTYFLTPLLYGCCVWRWWWSDLVVVAYSPVVPRLPYRGRGLATDRYWCILNYIMRVFTRHIMKVYGSLIARGAAV